MGLIGGCRHDHHVCTGQTGNWILCWLLEDQLALTGGSADMMETCVVGIAWSADVSSSPGSWEAAGKKAV